MAWENGENLYNYCLETFFKFTKNPKLFYEMLQIMHYFEQQNGFPYSIADLNVCFELKLGISFDIFKNYIIPGVSEIMHTESKITWDRENIKPFTLEESKITTNLAESFDEELLDHFENEMTLFVFTVAKSPAFHWADTNYNLYQLKTVEWLSRMNYQEEKLMRFIRADHEYIDIAMVPEIIPVLESIIELLQG